MSREVAILLDKLPAYQGDQRLISRRQDTFDIIREILNMHKKSEKLYNSIALEHWAGDEMSTARHLFDFMRANVPYKVEKTLSQTVKYPQAILGERLTFGNDCKHYASYIVGVGAALNRMGYPVKCFYRFGSYRDKSGKVSTHPGHVFAVFVINGREIWIDPVPEIGGFNSRTLCPVHKIDKMPAMKRHKGIGSLYEISGVEVSGFSGDNQLVAGAHHHRRHWLDEMPRAHHHHSHHGHHVELWAKEGYPMHHGDDMSGYDEMGKAGKGKAKFKKLVHKVTHPHVKIQPGKLLKKVTLTAPRNAYLALLKMNFLGKAVHIHNAIKGNPAAWNKLRDFWVKVGGDPNKLSTAINNGVSTHNKLHPHAKVSGYDNDMYVAGGFTEDHVSGTDDLLQMDGVGVVALAGAAALVAAAAPIIKAISNVLKSIGVHNDDAEGAAADADAKAGQDHNDATDIPGDGKGDINPDGSVDHGNGVTTKVTTGPDGKQTISYDVKDPVSESGGGSGDTGGSTGVQTKNDAGGGASGWLDNVMSYVGDHKVAIGLTAAGTAGLIFSIAHKFPKKSSAPVFIGLVSAGAMVFGGVKLFKK